MFVRDVDGHGSLCAYIAITYSVVNLFTCSPICALTACFRRYAARSAWQYACMRVSLVFKNCSTANMRTHLLFPPSVCEQAAARTLGYTQASWDDNSGNEVEPWSTIKSWDQLTKDEQNAAKILGYDNRNYHYTYHDTRRWDQLRSSYPNCKNIYPWPSAALLWLLRVCAFTFVQWRFWRESD